MTRFDARGGARARGGVVLLAALLGGGCGWIERDPRAELARIVKVAGPVIDVEFPRGSLPEGLCRPPAHLHPVGSEPRASPALPAARESAATAIGGEGRRRCAREHTRASGSPLD